MRQAQAHLHDAQVVSVMGMVGMAGLGFLQQEYASNGIMSRENLWYRSTPARPGILGVDEPLQDGHQTLHPSNALLQCQHPIPRGVNTDHGGSFGYSSRPGKPGLALNGLAPARWSADSAIRLRSSSASEGRSGGPSMEGGPAWAATCWMSVSSVVNSSCSALSFFVFSDLRTGENARSASCTMLQGCASTDDRMDSYQDQCNGLAHVH